MIAVVFPGQGSQRRGMGQDLAAASVAAARVFDEVSDAVKIDMKRICWHTPDDELRSTDNAQIALFTVGLAAYRALLEKKAISIGATAGHSVGEYAALVAAGVFTLEAGAVMVKARGDGMARAGTDAPGAMAAILGLDREPLEKALEDVPGVVVVANDNSPGQIVISGEAAAVEAAGRAATEIGAKRVIALNVSGAFHSPLMRQTATELRKTFDSPTCADAVVPIYANVTSEQEMDGSTWPALLERQIYSTVRWTETVQHMIRDGVTTFIECGTGDVLSGLIRRIDKSVASLKVNDLPSLETSIVALES